MSSVSSPRGSENMKKKMDRFAVASWYAYLQMAIQNGIQISKKYKSWGTEQEISTTKFSRWWRERGERLFGSAQAEVAVVSESEDFITLTVPRQLTSKDAVAQVRTALSGKVGKNFGRSSDEMAYTGRVHYAKLRQYERLLGIHLKPESANRPMDELGLALVAKYQLIEKASRARAQTLKKSGSKLWKRVAWIDPSNFRRVTGLEAFGDGSRTSKRQVSEVSYKNLRLWLASGFITLLNVADGQFPGKQSTGKEVTETVKKRLDRIGKLSLWSGHAKKGGGQVKAKLTQVEQRYTKAELKVRASKALKAGYGVSGSLLGHGNTTAPLTREQVVKAEMGALASKKKR